MNICMIAYTFYEGDNRVMRYAEALVARGDQVDVIALAKKAQSRVDLLNGVRVFRLQSREKNEKNKFSHLCRVLMFVLRATVVVAGKHLRRRYHLLHVHSVPDFLVLAAMLPRLSGARVILDIHDLLPELYASKFGSDPRTTTFMALQKVEQMSAALADHVIAPNHIWKDKLVRRSVHAHKCSVFMNYPDPAVFALRSRHRNDDKIILIYPGTLSQHQGVDIAICAFSRFAAKIPQAEFHIYGEGPSKEGLVKLAADLSLTRRVHFHHPLPLRQIASVIQSADIGVIPKRNNGFGDEAFSTKSLEFMMLGVPVVMADTRVDKHYFNPNVVTFFRSGDVDDLAACILRLVENKELRIQQSARARAFVEAYSWNSKRAEYFALVDQLTKTALRTGIMPAPEANVQR
jgi:glycosyltransferase involved in cell wall biosynthesis